MDLPSLRSKPSYDDLLDLLKSLKESIPGLITDKKLSDWLMSFFKSDFQWLQDTEALSAEAQKESLVELASLRLSERCGRSAQGEMNRTWIVPSSDGQSEVRLNLREPGQTGDDLGLKTWSTSYTIAKRLGIYLSNIAELTKMSLPVKDISIHGNKVEKPLAIELGSGTGLVGLAAAALWKRCVVVTDLPAIIPNLTYNVELNYQAIERAGGKILVAPLDWAHHEEALVSWSERNFQIVLASDPLYDDGHPELLASTIDGVLHYGDSARALVAVPLRDQTTCKLAEEFAAEMHKRAFRIVQKGSEITKDADFGGGQEVEVVAMVFARGLEA